MKFKSELKLSTFVNSTLYFLSRGIPLLRLEEASNADTVKKTSRGPEIVHDNLKNIRPVETRQLTEVNAAATMLLGKQFLLTKNARHSKRTNGQAIRSREREGMVHLLERSRVGRAEGVAAILII